MKRLSSFLVLLVILAFVSGCGFTPMTRIEPVVGEPLSVRDLLDYSVLDYHPSEVMVKPVDADAFRISLQEAGVQIKKEWPQIGWMLLSVPAGYDVLSYMDELYKDGNVLLAEPNLQYDAPDPMDLEVLGFEEMGEGIDWDRLWGLRNIKAPEAWEITTGSPNVIVAIIDTGVQMNHPEFSNVVFVGEKDVTGDDRPTIDLNGHGTHVAGTAAANGRGGRIAGVVWDSPIMPVRVMNNAGQIWNSYLTDSMIYLAEFVQNDPMGRRIVPNMSIGGRGYSFAFKDAIDYAAEHGVVLITSAGNATKRVISYPGAYNGVVSVAASTPHNEKADFSTIGNWNSVGAPGVRIWSTDRNSTFSNKQGTSMASPHVAGAAALLLAVHPHLTPLEIKNQLEKTANNFGRGYTEQLGHGIIDLPALLGPVQPLAYGSLEVRTNAPAGSAVFLVTDGFTRDLVTYGTSGDDGDHMFWALKAGVYNVSISFYNSDKDEYFVDNKLVTVNTGRTSTLHWELELPVERTAVVSGYVTDGRGGPRVAGATVQWQQWETVTSPSGFFALPIIAGESSDLLVYRGETGVTRVQGIVLEDGEVAEYAIPVRPVFDPAAHREAPLVSVNITPGQVLTGEVELTVEGITPADVYIIYVDFASEGRTGPAAVESNSVDLKINTARYPNGDTFLRVIVYDNNDNAAMLFVPVTVENDVTHEAAPAMIPWLRVVSHTRGQNVHFYGTDRQERLEAQIASETNPMKAMVLRSFLATEADQPLNAVQWVVVDWRAAPLATGYKVYRSFDGENYRLLGAVTTLNFQDRSPELLAGRTAYYKVVAYNSAGDAEGRVREVTPLPGYDVYLVAPANGAKEVSLTPTMTWRYNTDGQFPADVSFEDILTVFDVTYWRIIGLALTDQLSYQVPAGVLEPAKAYSWDILHSDAFRIETMDDFGLSGAISVANTWDDEGSINGEFVFTTITE